MIGETVQHYEILERLGEGGMGVVYKARDNRLGRLVALKFLAKERLRPRDLLRFQQEARAASTLNHPSICTIYDIGEHQSRPFMVMEYLQGQTLSERIQSGPILREELLVLCGRIAEGLEAAHSKGIVHRDIKPGNLVITGEGQVKILDFGVAKLRDSDAEEESSRTALTMAGTLVGTVHYMSPEQALGEDVDARSDLFSLGIVFYEMATGNRPFPGQSTVSVVNSIINKPAIPAGDTNPDLPEGFAGILDQLLAKRPEDRYSNARELCNDLQKLSESPTAPVPAPVSDPPLVRGRPKSKSLFLVITAASVVIAFGVWSLWQSTQVASPQIGGIALLPFSYQGPATRSNLAHMFPALLAESIRSNSDLAVAPYDSSRVYAADEDPGRVANELDVGWVLHGALDTRAEECKAQLTLTDFSNREIWQQQFRGSFDELFGAAEEAARAVTEALGAAKPTEFSGMARNTAAIEFYLQGRNELEGWDVESNYEKAQSAFSKAIELDDTFGEAHAGLALAIWKKWEESRDPELVPLALGEAEKALAKAPRHPESHLAYGVVQLGRGRSAEAMTAFEEASRLAPADDGVLRRIAQAYARLGRKEEAGAMFEAAIRLRPDFWENYLAKGNSLLDLGEYDQAKTAYRKVISLRPESDIGHNNLALAHLFLGEMEEAEVHLHAALAIQPNAAGHSNLGFIYYSAGQFSEAAKEFEIATRLSSEKAEAWINLGDAFRQLKQEGQALQAYDKATAIIRARLAIDSGNLVDRATLAYSLAGLAQCAEALQTAREATTGTAETPIIHYYAAVAAALCKADPEAARYIVRAIESGLVADVRTNPDLQRLLSLPPVKQALKSADRQADSS